MRGINKEDFVVGRIYQRVLEKMQITDYGFTIVHEIERTVDVDSVIEKLFLILPDVDVTLKRLPYSYSVIIQNKKCDISDAVVGKRIKVSDYFNRNEVPQEMKKLRGATVTISDANDDMIKINECGNKTIWLNITLLINCKECEYD